MKVIRYEEPTPDTPTLPTRDRRVHGGLLIGSHLNQATNFKCSNEYKATSKTVLKKLFIFSTRNGNHLLSPNQETCWMAKVFPLRPLQTRRRGFLAALRHSTATIGQRDICRHLSDPFDPTLTATYTPQKKINTRKKERTLENQ